MMQVYIVTAEHFNVPGERVSTHRTKAGADAMAADLVNSMLGDATRSWRLDRVGPVPSQATAATWQEVAQWLRDKANEQLCDEDCYVSVDEYELKD